MCYELRQSFAFLPSRTEARIRVAKPSESHVKKFIRGRSAPIRALSIEGPAENKLCGTIIASSHTSEPMIDERRLSHPGPGNDCNNVGVLICPSTIQESDILLPAKNIAACNGQSGY